MWSVLVFSILTPITGGEVIVRNPNLWPGTMANCEYLANPQGFQQDRDRSSSVHGLNLNMLKIHSLGLLFASWSLDILPMFNVLPANLTKASDFIRFHGPHRVFDVSTTSCSGTSILNLPFATIHLAAALFRELGQN